MNFNQLINMVMRMFTQRAMNWGMRRATRTARKTDTGKVARKDDGLTPAQRKQQAQAREATKRARQAARITRRIGR
ncbi:MAG: hypothetical protein Q4G14_10670 [Paracoccus sp. (in: a-proteobacteria)]|uniref:hypothetical protein n=1 Tax=Paracoccus sp. TaxID=267 RepID=UPI0026DFCE8F|nr:hypothetical protein [Paracoccus sp. (in: a-proteobacteria)]MDO5613687.1 hypothetical protein [Paracoccus sp. (in: a-proteobacteria)]